MTTVPLSMAVSFTTAYVTQLAKASDTQAVGHGFKPCPDH